MYWSRERKVEPRNDLYWIEKRGDKWIVVVEGRAVLSCADQNAAQRCMEEAAKSAHGSYDAASVVIQLFRRR